MTPTERLQEEFLRRWCPANEEHQNPATCLIRADLSALITAAREEALEEAAIVAALWEPPPPSWFQTEKHIAQVIRDLKHCPSKGWEGARAEALEEAARVVEGKIPLSGVHGFVDCRILPQVAAAIRSLKRPAKGGESPNA